MTREFEPFNNEFKSSEFNAWDLTQHQIANKQPNNDNQEIIDECELLKQQAVEKGYAEGMLQAQQDINTKKAELTYWINLLQQPIKLIDEKLSQELIQTIIWLAEHCIHVEISAKPELLRSLLDAIKQEIPTLHENNVFAMHPQDVEWVKAEFSEKEIPGLYQVLHPDPTLTRGDFYLRNEHSDLDGRIKARLATLFSKYINKELILNTHENHE